MIKDLDIYLHDTFGDKVAFLPIDFPREVLELPSSGERGWRRLVKNASELERYWSGKNGSGNVYFTAYGYNETQAPKHHRVDYNTPKDTPLRTGLRL